jgi:hypothetical protein
MVCAVVGAGTVAFVNLDQGPEPVDQYGTVQEGDAVIATSTAIAITLVAAGAGATSGAVICSQEVLICQGDTEAEAKAEKHETRVELASRASTTAQKADVFLDTMENSVSNGKSIARQKGMTAYWNAIENGSSLSAAKQAGIRAAEQYYHVKYKQVANSWSLTHRSWINYQSIEDSSGLNFEFVGWAGSSRSPDMKDMGNVSLTSPSGKQVSFVAANVNKIEAYPKSETDMLPDGAYKLSVAYKNQSIQTVTTTNLTRYGDLLQQIQQDSDEVNQAIRTVANKTYEEAVNGQINVSEMLSANAIASEYSREGNDQAWAAVRLSQMRDVGLPKDLDGIGTVSVKSGGQTTTGLFLSYANPSNGSFRTGTTYNASKIAGQQLVVKESGEWAEITGTFSLSKIESASGGSRDSLTIRDPTVEATNISEWKERMDRLEQMRAEINARQQALLNDSSGGSGGLFDFGSLAGSLPFGGTGVLAALGAIVVLGLVTRN